MKDFIGFKSPASDACAVCVRLKNLLASSKGDQRVLKNL